MSAYENYIQEKLRQAELKIESLYYQLSLEQQENAKKEILLRKIKKCEISGDVCNECQDISGNYPYCKL